MTKRTRALDISRKVKDAVWHRDGECCVLCGNPEAMPNAHYVPRSQGGLGIEENVATLCRRCHDDYDHTAKRGEIKEKIRDYLMGCYPEWDEKKLVYRKY